MKLILVKRISKCCTRLRKWGRFSNRTHLCLGKESFPFPLSMKYEINLWRELGHEFSLYLGWRLLCKQLKKWWWLVMEFLLWNQHQQQSCQVFVHEQHFSGQLSHCWHSRFDWTTEKVRRSRLGYRRELITRVSQTVPKGIYLCDTSWPKTWVTLRPIELQRNH